MVEIINNQKGSHMDTVDFFESFFKSAEDLSSDLFRLSTQDYVGNAVHKYTIISDSVLTIEDDKLYIKSGSIIEVIDLLKEKPFEIIHKTRGLF